MNQQECLCIKPVSAALTVGTLWALTFFVWTLVSMQNGFGSEALSMFISFYPGSGLSIGGALIGMIWAFVDVSLAVWGVLSLYLWVKSKLNK